MTRQAPIIKTAHRKEASSDEWILSDDSEDRVGDVIDASGWELENFKKNPVALFAHDSGSLPIGKWENVRVEGKQLIGKLVTAAKGTHAMIDGVISLIEQKILNAVSVGFMPKEMEPIPQGGWRFLRQELLEVSVVPVPANPNAVRRAKGLHIPDDALRLAFGESAVSPEARRNLGKPAGPSAKPSKGTKSMNTLSKRIEDLQARLVSTQEELAKHIDVIGDEASDDDNAITEGYNEQIDTLETSLKNLQEAEKRLAVSVVNRNDASGSQVDKGAKPFAIPAKKVEPIDYIFRGMVVAVKAHVEKRNPVDILRETYGEDQTTKAVTDIVLNKAAVAPADTATPAWAGALVQTAIGDFFELLMPQSVYPRLSAIGGRFGFGRNGTVSLPTRDATPTVAGSFVGEGAPIPVRRAGFSAVTLTPKKMAVITTMTREITERSTPQIEQLLRNAIQEDTAVSIDSVLLDALAATTIRPAGLRNGATTAAGTAGGDIAAVRADVKGMLGSLITATAGNIRNPVWIMNPIQALGLSMVENAAGDTPFEEEITGGRFRGYPVIQSTTVPAGTVLLLDAADFFSATGDDPRFDVSDQATLHMEDTTPLQISTAGTPNVVAAPVRSMFQTDSLALRMILPMNWALRRPNMVVERTAVTW
jgi:HK97 family phage major capsid protein/HK97 family phage prohead protease